MATSETPRENHTAEDGVDLDNLDFRDDPDLLPVEKETLIRFDGNEEIAYVETRKAVIARRLLAHPDFNETRRYGDGERIHGVAGEIPLAYITIGSKERENPGLAKIVSGAVYDD